MSHPASPENAPPKASALLADLRAALPLLERSEIVAVLEELQRDAQEELARSNAFSARAATLLTRIAVQSDYPALHQVHRELNTLEMERFLAYRSVPALHAACTAYRDALAGRVLDLVAREMGSPPPLPFALISMGSDGREEQTLITDQDYLLLYDDVGDGSDTPYFHEFAGLLVERLAEIGFKKCTGDIMPSNPRWCGSLSQWVRRLVSIVRYESMDYGKNVMDLIILSDARLVAGDPTLAEALIGQIRLLERDYFQALWGMAKAATEMKVALTFLKRIWTEGSGAHKGEFNLKLLGWAPLVMNVRILAISQGIPASNTIRRLELLREEGSLSAAMAEGLCEAYRVLTEQRIVQQIEVIEGRRDDAYYLAPDTLTREERERMRRALLRIEELQRIIHTNFLIM